MHLSGLAYPSSEKRKQSAKHHEAKNIVETSTTAAYPVLPSTLLDAPTSAGINKKARRSELF